MRVLDFCEDAEFIYIVFELIETGDLSKNIKIIKEKLPTQSRQAIEGVVANLMHQIIILKVPPNKKICSTKASKKIFVA